MVDRTSEGTLWDYLTAWGSCTKMEQRCVDLFISCMYSTQGVSFTRRCWITPVITTRPVRQSRMFMFVGALNGIATNSNYRSVYLWLIFFSLTNSVAAAWRMLSTLATLTLWVTSHGSRLLRMRQQSGNTIPLQPCFRQVSRCDRCYSYTCNQGNSPLFHSFVSLNPILLLRFRHPDNVLNTFTAPSSVAAFLKVLRYLYIVISDGAQHSQCSIRPTNSVRYELIHCVPYSSNYYIKKPIALFVSSADEMYGPITTLRHDNRLVKHIPWSKMVETDWTRVVDARDILEVSKVLIHFAARANKEDRT